MMHERAPAVRVSIPAAAILIATLLLHPHASSISGVGQSDAIDAGFKSFWAAENPREAAKAAERLLRARVDFDAAWDRLKKGRTYSKAATGVRSKLRRMADATFDNTIDIPEDYDPARRWQVRVQLHGGIARPAPQEAARRRENRIAGEKQIYVFPSGWNDASWWHAVQVENILTLVDRLKREYNVDESRIYLTGVSDGGTGVYFFAMREATPWSAFLPLNANIAVLANPDVGADGELYAGNLVNRPFFIVNGGRDALYPVSQIAPQVELMRRAGVPIVFHPQPLAGHDTSWWPAERSAYETFVHEHPREPYPERLSWETERVDRYNRIHWLAIDSLGSMAGDVAFDEVSLLGHRGRSGRVDAVRSGNTIDARTRGVRGFTLLLSPDVFDFSAPIRVTVNGRPAFHGIVRKDPGVLLKWAARDNDRTMLFGAELKIAP